MVQRQPQPHPDTPVVTDKMKTIEAERLHHTHLIVGGSSLAVRGMVEAGGRRLVAVAVATEVGADDGEVRRQSRCHLAPFDMALWIPVKQQQCRA